MMSDPNIASPEVIEAERQKLRKFFETFPFFRLMGFELVDMEPGRARLSMSWRKDLCQPSGIMHGGAIASLIDTSIAHSILLTPANLEAKTHGGRMVSVDVRVKYLRPVSAGRIYCDARVTRLGRQIIHTAATVTNDDGKEVATGDSIYMIVAKERLQKKSG